MTASAKFVYFSEMDLPLHVSSAAAFEQLMQVTSAVGYVAPTRRQKWWPGGNSLSPETSWPD